MRFQNTACEAVQCVQYTNSNLYTGPPVRFCVDVGTLLDEQLGRVQVAQTDRQHQGGPTMGVPILTR